MLIINLMFNTSEGWIVRKKYYSYIRNLSNYWNKVIWNEISGDEHECISITA